MANKKPISPQSIPVIVPIGLVTGLLGFGLFFGLTGNTAKNVKKNDPNPSSEVKPLEKVKPEPITTNKKQEEVPVPKIVEPVKGPSGGTIN